MKRKTYIVQGSLTDGPCDVLINASNTNLELGSGVSGALRLACGEGYQSYLKAELDRRGGVMEPGQVLVTHAGQHGTAQHVVHAAVMDYRNGFTGSSYPTLELVEEAYARIWKEVAGLQAQRPLSVAVVALGAGTGNLGARGPIEVACQTLVSFFADQQGGNEAGGEIGDVYFFGYALHEFIAMVEVVSQYFDIPPETLPVEVRDHIAPAGL